MSMITRASSREAFEEWAKESAGWHQLFGRHDSSGTWNQRWVTKDGKQFYIKGTDQGGLTEMVELILKRQDVITTVSPGRIPPGVPVGNRAAAGSLAGQVAPIRPQPSVAPNASTAAT